jgi:hypothetical protein
VVSSLRSLGRRAVRVSGSRGYSFGLLAGLVRQACSARLLRAEALEGGLAGHTEDIADVRPCGPAVKGGVHRVTEGNAGRLERG